MRKLYLSLFFVLGAMFSLENWASEVSCIRALTNQHETNSTTFQFNRVEAGFCDAGKDRLALSISYVRWFLKEKGCVKGDVDFSKGPQGRSHSRCQQMSNELEQSTVCYIESNLGNFFVTEDFFDQVHIIYNRWD